MEDVQQQEYCLRWNNHQTNFVSSFNDLRQELDFVDVTLACEGQSLQAHKVVLSACSPFFRHLFTTTPCQHPIIVLKDIAFNDLILLVEYCYMGTVRVKQQGLSTFLKAAEVLKVCGLAESSAGISKTMTPPITTSAVDCHNQNDKAPVLSPPDEVRSEVDNVSNINSFPLFSKKEPNTGPSDEVAGSSILGVASIDTDTNNTIEPIDIKIEDMNFDSKDNNGSEDENAASNNLEHEIEPNSDDHSAILDGQQLLTPQNFARIASSTSEDISLDSLHYSVDNACEKQDPLSGIFGFESTTTANDSCQASTQVCQAPGRVCSSDRPRWPCPFCNRLLSSRSSVRRHIEDKHSADTTRHQCTLCERLYRTRNSLQYHLSTAHRDRVHTAPRGRPRVQRPTSPSITESDLLRDGLSQNLDNEPNLNTNSSLHLQFS